MLLFGLYALRTSIGLALLQEEEEDKIFRLMPASNTNLIVTVSLISQFGGVAPKL